jgi:hypothetical protein
MMEQMIDVMAGERARTIRKDPAAPQPVTDPTDPRYAKLGGLPAEDPQPARAPGAPEARARAGAEPRG